jgi:hypothetical protein
VLLIDDYSSHRAPIILEVLSIACVSVVTFAPHTVHIFQVLDLTLSGVLYKSGQYQLPCGDHAAGARFIKKIYHDVRRTMFDVNIRDVQKTHPRFVLLNVRAFFFSFCSIMETFTLLLFLSFRLFDPDLRGNCAHFLSKIDKNAAHRVI